MFENYYYYYYYNYKYYISCHLNNFILNQISERFESEICSAKSTGSSVMLKYMVFKASMVIDIKLSRIALEQINFITLLKLHLTDYTLFITQSRVSIFVIKWVKAFNELMLLLMVFQLLQIDFFILFHELI